MKCNTAKFAILLAATAVLFWWPSSKFQFLNYDDNEYVFENPAMREGLSPSVIKWAFNCGYAANWHPLAWLSMMADVSLVRAAERFGLVRRGKPLHDTWALDCDETALARTMHIHNILLHAANTVLLFLLIGAILDKTWLNGLVGAFFALIWCIHPLRCEVVCWLSERKELLSVFFMLLALMAYKGFKGHKGTGMYLAAIGFHALALMAKPVAVSLPLVVFAHDWMICDKGFRSTFLRTLPFTAMSIMVCLFTLSAQREAMPGLGDMSAGVRMSCVLKAPLVYLVQTFFPYGTSSWYAVPRRPEWIWAVAGALLVGSMVAVLVWWFRVRSRLAAWMAFAVAWLYGGLVPMLGFVKVGGQPHSDRYTYWVGCGFAVLLALAFARISARCMVQPRMAYRLSLALLAPYAACGFLRMFAWHDSLSLFRDGYENSREPDQAFTYASNLMPEGRYAEAEAVMREAASVHRDAKTHARLALVLAQKEKSPSLAEAKHLAESALAGDPKVGEAHAALGHICLREGRNEEAVWHYEQAGENGFKDRLVERLLKDHRQGKAIGLEAQK